MDPDANLEEQRRCIRTMLVLDDAISIEDRREWEMAATRLAELAQALDEWLCNGGAKPRVWTRRPGT